MVCAKHNIPLTAKSEPTVRIITNVNRSSSVTSTKEKDVLIWQSVIATVEHVLGCFKTLNANKTICQMEYVACQLHVIIVVNGMLSNNNLKSINVVALHVVIVRRYMQLEMVALLHLPTLIRRKHGVTCFMIWKRIKTYHWWEIKGNIVLTMLWPCPIVAIALIHHVRIVLKYTTLEDALLNFVFGQQVTPPTITLHFWFITRKVLMDILYLTTW